MGGAAGRLVPHPLPGGLGLEVRPEGELRDSGVGAATAVAACAVIAFTPRRRCSGGARRLRILNDGQVLVPRVVVALGELLGGDTGRNSTRNFTKSDLIEEKLSAGIYGKSRILTRTK